MSEFRSFFEGNPGRDVIRWSDVHDITNWKQFQFGVDLVAPGSDRTSYRVICGMNFVCEIPAALGAVCNMRIVNGRIVCTTESGVEFVAPAS